MFKSLMTAVIAVLFISSAAAQNDPVLFTVNGKPVYASEFKYIYSKANQEKADFSEKSLRDYLELYTNFKLKVQKARDTRLDTITSLIAELDGYKKELAKSYLEDREVTDKLVKDVYERMGQDVDVSHIFLACDRSKNAPDTSIVYNRALNLMKMIQKGGDFNKIAVDSSEDKTAKENKGNIGFITAMLPDGYYAFEKAIYGAKPGALVGPIRSNNGYHIVRVNGFRPARGEVEVSQILVRKGDTPEKQAAAKMKADSAYNALVAGTKWEDVCAKYTEDKATAGKGGYVGFFGINRYQKAFEDAAFAIDKDGAFSPVVETSIGYHIIKRVSRRGLAKFDDMKRGLTERVKRDSRSEIARQAMIARIRKEAGYQEFPAVLKAWTAKQVDTIFLTFKWKPDPAKPQDVLNRYGGKEKSYTVADFEEFCAKSSRERMRGVGIPLAETIQKLYNAWADETSIQYEESHLDKKYPEFKSLMHEYEEGILLFEALKIHVWDRANSDSVGLESYFRLNLSQKYKWDERARVSFYTLKTDDPKVLADVRTAAAKMSADDVKKKFNANGEVLTVIEKLYERGKNKDLGSMWKAGDMTDGKTDAGTKTASFLKIEEILPPQSKTLAEARGYAVADYQDYLEKKWVDDLRKEYTIKLNEDVLKSLVKK